MSVNSDGGRSGRVGGGGKASGVNLGGSYALLSIGIGGGGSLSSGPVFINDRFVFRDGIKMGVVRGIDDVDGIG